MTAPARLWFGTTSHTREQPFRRGFKHRVAMLEVDIDRLSEATKLSRLFSVDRGNAISFRQADYGQRKPGASLRRWAEDRFEEAGIELDRGQIRLLSFPRVLGYGFAPISVWLGHDAQGALRGVIYEVHNTFGETHSYVSAYEVDGGRMRAGKDFHVSPFFDVSGEYRFTLNPGENGLGLVVENMSPDGRRHVASLSVQPTALTTAAILKWLIAMPISGLGVMAAIHWQALRLLMKGAKYRDKPEQRANRTTRTKPEHAADSGVEDLRERA
ncbi:MAG TPA: DUF1365 domain-containing protein [Hyphomonadaceae bacterium]|nr:DUF1365 domain-containing protein [Hyphomonadaceae bacterium]HPN05417.1 DUF1365 domain-containing protein [Hyphomonadaceae bacterium]